MPRTIPVIEILSVFADLAASLLSSGEVILKGQYCFRHRYDKFLMTYFRPLGLMLIKNYDSITKWVDD